MLSTRRESSEYHLKVFGVTQPGLETTTYWLWGSRSTTGSSLQSSLGHHKLELHLLLFPSSAALNVVATIHNGSVLHMVSGFALTVLGNIEGLEFTLGIADSDI